MSKIKNLLLTGCNGYIGSQFVNQHYKNYNIYGVDTNYFGFEKNTFDKLYKFQKKDIRELEEEDFKNIDYVVHMGELSNDPLGELSPEITYEINHLGTKKLSIILNKTKVKKFIYMSSCSVYGNNPDLVNETTKLNPLTEYANAKVLNENFLLENSFNYQVAIFRNATAFGFSPNLRLDLVINQLTYESKVLNKIKLLSSGEQKRPFVHISDINNIIKLTLEKSLDEKLLLNIGSSNLNSSIINIAKKISLLTGVKNIELNSEVVDNRNYHVDFSKLKYKFNGYKFLFDFNNGINDLLINLNNYKNNNDSIRIQKLANLLDNKKLNNKLFWN